MKIILMSLKILVIHLWANQPLQKILKTKLSAMISMILLPDETIHSEEWKTPS